MDFKGYIMKGIEIVKLNRDVAEEVSKDQEAFVPAIAFFAIGGLAGGIGAILGGGSVGMIIGGPIIAVAASFIGVGILYLLAKLFGGTGDYKGYYTALGIGGLPYWAMIIPFLGGLVSLWGLPVAVIVTERVHKISTGKAIMVVLIPLVVVVLLMVLVFASLMAFMGMSGRTPGM